MKCEEVTEFLPQYLHGGLDEKQSAGLAEHLQACAECADQLLMWKKLALLPEETPSRDSRERFEAMLDAYRTGRESHAGGPREMPRRGNFWDALSWLSRPVGALAWSAVVLALGVFVGARMGGGKEAG